MPIKYESSERSLNLVAQNNISFVKSRSGKMIPGKTSISIAKVGDKDKIKGRLNPSLVPVNPFPKGFGEDVNKHEIIREMTDFTRRFPESSARFSPYLSFENNLFFLPELVNFSRYSAHGVSTRNICCEVKLMDDDSDPNRPGMKVNSTHLLLSKEPHKMIESFIL